MQDIIQGPQGTSAYICLYLFIIYNDLINIEYAFIH